MRPAHRSDVDVGILARVDKPARLIIRFVIWICSDSVFSIQYLYSVSVTLKENIINTETACCVGKGTRAQVVSMSGASGQGAQGVGRAEH